MLAEMDPRALHHRDQIDGALALKTSLRSPAHFNTRIGET